MTGAAVMPNSTMPTSEVVSILTAQFLTPAEVGAVLKVSRKVLADWRLKPQGPPFTLKAGGAVVYPAESFKNFLRARLQEDCRERIGPREVRWSRAKGLDGGRLPNGAARLREGLSVNL